MKTIGFIDYYISEWHANNYPAWIDEVNRKTGADFVLGYAWAQLDKSPVDGRTTEEWCKAFHAVKCESIAEICEKSDYLMILAPSNPEKHLAYAEEALKYGKATCIDKTFAPDCETAKKIYGIAEKYGTTIFSSSALRYSDELKAYDCNARTIATTGGGSNLPEYIIHQIEMVVKCMGCGAQKVTVTKIGDRSTCNILYGDGRSAVMTYAPRLPFTVCPTGKDGETDFYNVSSPFFVNFIGDVLNFFATGKPSFEKAQTIEAMRIRDGVLKAYGSEDMCIMLS